MDETYSGFGSALELYRSTGMSVKDICILTGTHEAKFRAYLRRHHRHLIFARQGIVISPERAAVTPLRARRGQSIAAHARYREAVLACDNTEFIEMNVTQIARRFHVSVSGLRNQLRVHFPEILERREKERRRRGIAANYHTGVRQASREQYAEAVEHLRTTDDTLRQTADLFNLSVSGLQEHLLYYHKELLEHRTERRRRAEGVKRRGELTGNGQRHNPTPALTERFSEAIRLYRTTSMTQKEIAAATGLDAGALENHIRMWHRNLILERRGAPASASLAETKHYLRSTAAKYAPAIEKLHISSRSIADVAKECGVNAESLRNYLKEHEPELAVSRSRKGNAAKYEAAINAYITTTETLKSIAARMGIPYNSIGGYIRRNRPEAIELHNRLVEDMRGSVAADISDESERDRIVDALRLACNNRRRAAAILGISRSTLYKKIAELKIEI